MEKRSVWVDVFRIWNRVWGIIGVLAVLTTLIVGLVELYDRFLIEEESALLKVKEYIFASQYYYVQALTNNEGHVLAYGVTTRDRDFNPSFIVAPNRYWAIGGDINNLSSGSKEVILGKTKFSDLGEPVDAFVYLGAHDFYYHEEYYYGNSGEYQSYFVALNQNGYANIYADEVEIPDTFYRRGAVDIRNLDVIKFRKDSS